VPDHNVFLPPPPPAGSALGEADVAIFAATRALESGPRWQLAASDDRINQKAMLGNFSCALGVDVASAETPALARVLTRSGADLFPLIGAAKDKYQRPRPFVTEQGPVCITPSEGFAKSGSYPSGHAASGWHYALLLAEIDPAHAAAIVNRGRAFGESRVVCGVHYPTDIEAGRLTASALIAALHGTPEFETDVAAARAELTSLRAANAVAAPPAAACDSESAILATPW
jgi:acid phosphatase (class A)